MTRCSGLLAALVLLAVPDAAVAHGRFPATGQIAFHPTDPETIVVRATFGLLVSVDGGGEWRWICTEVSGARLTEDPTIAVTPDGSIVSAMFGGIARGTDGGCSWGFPDPDLEGVIVIDQAQHPTDPATLLAVTSRGDGDNLVYRSTDQGVSWEPTSEPIEPILFEAIAIAPSDPGRVYLSGSYPATAMTPRQPFVHRSTDGGASWERLPFTDFDPATDQNIYVLGVDPTDPEHVMLRVKGMEDDRLLRSTDGGTSWTLAATMPSIDGFAWSEDGSTAWAGGNASGLWRSDDGGETFVQTDAELDLGCLAVRGDELWACGDNFTDGFAIGRSTDRGDSFEAMLLLMDVAGMVECAPESATATTCAAAFPDLVADLGLDSDAGVPDAGTGGTEPPENGGCGCRAAGRGSLPEPWIVALAGILVARVRRRRARC